LKNIISICCGGFTSFATQPEGKTFVFGSNECSELSPYFPELTLLPTECSDYQGKQIIPGYRHTILIHESGTTFYGAAFGEPDVDLSNLRVHSQSNIKSARK